MHFSNITVEDFLRQAASGAPTPGGGGIAALAGALGSAMASMVVNFTVGKPKYAEHEESMQKTLRALLPIIEDFRTAIDDDAHAFSGISDAYKLPRDNDEAKTRRQDAIQTALTASMKVPLRILRCASEAAALLPDIARHGNANLLSDAVVAAIMLAASSRAALVNVYANSTSLKTEEAREAEAEGERIVEKVAGLAAQTEEIVKGRNAAQ